METKEKSAYELGKDLEEKAASIRARKRPLATIGSWGGKVRELQQALERANPDERFDLFKGIASLWMNGITQPSYSGVVLPEYFGDIVYGYAKEKRPLIGTLTQNRNQLRLWLDRPGDLRSNPNHCDSAGGIYLIEALRDDATGSAMDQRRYLRFLDELLGKPVIFDDWSAIWAKGDEPQAPKLQGKQWINYGDVSDRSGMGTGRRMKPDEVWGERR